MTAVGRWASTRRAAESDQPTPHRRDARGTSQSVVLEVEGGDVAHGVGDKEGIVEGARAAAAAQAHESAAVEVHVR